MRAVLALALTILLAFAGVAEAGRPFLFFSGSGSAPASYVQSIQRGTITIASGSTSNTATITSVDTTKAIILYQGLTATSTSSVQSVASRIELTNGTTVTATRGASNTDSVTVAYTVIEFNAHVNSVQAGTVLVTAIQTSNTATISSVGSNAFVLFLGATSLTPQTSWSRVATSVDLTNSTTVTAHIGLATSAMTVGYMVVDLDSSLVTSVQKVAITDATAAASYTQTITAVPPEHTLIFHNGETMSVGTAAGSIKHTLTLTDATTVTAARGSVSSTNSRTVYGTAVEFAGGALNGSVQRGSIALSTQTSATATLTNSINTAKSFANYGGMRSTVANPDVTSAAQQLTNSNTVTTTVNTASSPVTAYAVMQFN